MRTSESKSRQVVGRETPDSYKVIQRCSNCESLIVTIIPKGKTIDGFLGSDDGQAAVCENCGCQAFPEEGI